MQVELTVLCDNHADAPLCAEHGLSFWLQSPHLALLLDTGCGTTLLHNADQLAIQLDACQHLVLSHGHYDHSGGISAFRTRNPDSQIWAHPDARLARYSRHPDRPVRAIGMVQEQLTLLSQQAATQLHWTEQPVHLASWLGTSGEIPRLDPLEDVGGPFFLDAYGHQADPLRDDQSLWLKTRRGLVILTGCCHSGLINTIRQVQKITGIERVAGIIGGLHLLHASDARLHHTLQFLQTSPPDFMWLGHCTGDAVIEQIRLAFPEVEVQTLKAGARYVLNEIMDPA